MSILEHLGVAFSAPDLPWWLVEAVGPERGPGIQLAALDISLRHHAAGGNAAFDLPWSAGPQDVALAGITYDCAPGDHPRAHLTPWMRMFTFAGDVVKAPDALLQDPPELTLEMLGALAAVVGSGIERVYGLVNPELFVGLQATIWAAQAVHFLGPHLIGMDTEDEAAAVMLERFLPGAAGLG